MVASSKCAGYVGVAPGRDRGRQLERTALRPQRGTHCGSLPSSGCGRRRRDVRRAACGTGSGWRSRYELGAITLNDALSVEVCSSRSGIEPKWEPSSNTTSTVDGCVVECAGYVAHVRPERRSAGSQRCSRARHRRRLTLNYTPGVNIANATTVALNSSGESASAHPPPRTAPSTSWHSSRQARVSGRWFRRACWTPAATATRSSAYRRRMQVDAGTFTKVRITGRGGVPIDAWASS